MFRYLTTETNMSYHFKVNTNKCKPNFIEFMFWDTKI